LEKLKLEVIHHHIIHVANDSKQERAVYYVKGQILFNNFITEETRSPIDTLRKLRQESQQETT
jgi:hypothetical protein